MGSQRYISFILILLSVLLWGEDVLAQLPDGNQDLTIFADTTADLSLSYLRYIFGNVGPLQGTTNMFVGTMFTLFNLGMVTFVAGFAGYTGIYAGLSAAADGTEIRQKVKMWTVIRMSVGAASLAPVQSGYSGLQIMIMWVVVQGVSVADAMWDRALDYIKQMQGVVFSDPLSQQYSDLDTLINQEAGKMNAKAIMQAALCNRHKYYEGYTLENAKTNQSYDLRFGTMCDSSSAVQVCLGSASNPTECGHFKYTSQSNASIVNESMQNAVYGMVSVMTNTVNSVYDRLLFKQFTDQINQSSTAGPDLVNCHVRMSNGEINKYPGSCLLANAMVSSASTYYSLSKVARMVSTVGNSDSNMGWMSGSEKNGWASAGFFYSQLMRNNTDASPGSQAALANIANFMASAEFKLPKVPNDSQPNNMVYTYLNGGIEGRNISFVSFARKIVAGMKEANDPLRSEKKKISIPGMAGLGSSMNEQYVEQIEDPVFDYAAAMLINTLVVSPSNIDIEYNQATLSMFGVANYALMNIVNALADVVTTFSGIQVSRVSPPTYNQPIEFNEACLNIPQCGSDNHSGCMFAAIKKGCISRSGTGLLSAISYEADNNRPISPLVTVSKMGDAFFRAGVSYIFYTNTKAYESLMSMAGAMTGYQVASLIVAGIAGGIMATFSQEGAAYLMTFLSNDLNGLFNLLYQISFQFMTMFIGTGTTVAIMMFGMGSTLSIYLPLLPFVIYTLAVISWFMVVIEAMVAAPIISLGLAHPSNNQYIGSTEQGIMLLFMVLTRPSVMLLGLMFSIMVSHVSMRIVNYAFMFLIGQTYQSLVVAGSNDGIAGFMISFALMIVYTYVCFVVLNYSFQLIHQLPERINRWLGGGQMSFGGGDITMMASGIQQGINDSTQGIARGAQFDIRMMRPVDVSAIVKIAGIQSVAQQLAARATLSARQFQYREFARNRFDTFRENIRAIRNDPRQTVRDMAIATRDGLYSAGRAFTQGAAALGGVMMNGLMLSLAIMSRDDDQVKEISDARAARAKEAADKEVQKIKSLTDESRSRPTNEAFVIKKLREYRLAGISLEILAESFTLSELVKAGFSIKQLAQAKEIFQKKDGMSIAHQLQAAGVARGEMLKYNYWAERNGATKIDGANQLRAYGVTDKFEMAAGAAGSYLANSISDRAGKLKESIKSSAAYMHENYIKAPEGKLPIDKRFFDTMDQNRIVPNIGPSTMGESVRSAYYAYGRAVRKIPYIGQLTGFIGTDKESMDAHETLAGVIKSTPKDESFMTRFTEKAKEDWGEKRSLASYSVKQLERAGATSVMIKAIKGEQAIDPLRDTFVGRMRNAYNGFFYGTGGMVTDLIMGRMRAMSQVVRGTNTPVREQLVSGNSYQATLKNESLTSLQRAGVNFETMKRAIELKQAGDGFNKAGMVTELKSLGYTNREIMRLGVMDNAMAVRSQLNDYRNGQIGLDELKQINNPIVMARAGASITEMHALGYNAYDLHHAGFSQSEIRKVYPAHQDSSPATLTYTQKASNTFTAVSSASQATQDYISGVKSSIESSAQSVYNSNLKWSEGTNQAARAADNAMRSEVNRITAIGVIGKGIGKGIAASVNSVSNVLYRWMGTKE